MEPRSKTRQDRGFRAGHHKDLSSDVLMRAKLGPASKSPDVDDAVSVPSQLSNDMWGEVPKFQAYKQEEAIRKERESFLKKRSMVKQTLDQQMQDRIKEKQAIKNKEREMDKMILEKAREEIETEQKRKNDLILKTLAAKEERDR